MRKGRIVFEDSHFLRIRHSSSFQILLESAPVVNRFSMGRVGRSISIDFELCSERAFPPKFEFQAVRALSLAVVMLRTL